MLLLAALVVLGALVLTSPSPSGAAAPTLTVGSATLHHCGVGKWCGTLPVPLDHARADSPSITVCFAYWPATGGSSVGTVLPVEGGPGYPSIGSVAGSSGFLAMYGSQLADHNLLSVDLRGTGCSTPLDCPTIQAWTGPTGTDAFANATGSCADSLNHRWTYGDGTFAQGSSLFTSAQSADDVAAVLAELAIPQVDLYGDSYGSWFAQVFAADHPALIHSVLLDSTYQVQGLDPWYRSSIASMPANHDAVCAGTPACAAFGTDAWSRVGQAAAALRSAPVSGTVPGPDGTPVTTSMDTVGLVDLVNDAGADPAIYATLDAADRALLDGHDPLPLLRLYAGRLASDEAYFGGPASQYSVALYLAVSCSDYPQLFDANADPAARPGQLSAAIAALPAATFAPFTTPEWLAMNQNTESFTACLHWPAPTTPIVPVPHATPWLPTSVPVLVLGGQFDIWTPPAGVPPVLAQMGGDSRFIQVANETHVVGEPDAYGCADSLIRAFVADPTGIDHLDASCAATVPSLRAAATYPHSLAATPAATDPSLSTAADRLVAAAVETAGDEWVRTSSLSLSRDTGLHGGRSVTGARGITLKELALIPGTTVSGSLVQRGSGETAVIVVSLTAHAPGHPTLTITGRWPAYGGQATAAVTVTAAGATSTATLPAPVGAPV